MHSQNIAHLDLKPSNLYVQDSTIKIGDFGFSQKCKSNFKETEVKGTPFYMAPEVEREKIFNLKSDVFSLGMILYELMSSFRTNSERV